MYRGLKNFLKKEYKTILLSFIVMNYSYAMNKTEEEMFHENLARLSKQIVSFVEDFKTWSKDNQNKLLLCSNSGGVSFVPRRKGILGDSYYVKIDLLQKNLTTDQTIPLFFCEFF